MANFDSFDGQSLYYDDQGDGPTVVLLHGFAADMNVNYVRSGILDLLLDEGYRVVALDRARGSGSRPSRRTPSRTRTTRSARRRRAVRPPRAA